DLVEDVRRDPGEAAAFLEEQAYPADAGAEPGVDGGGVELEVLAGGRRRHGGLVAGGGEGGAHAEPGGERGAGAVAEGGSGGGGDRRQRAARAAGAVAGRPRRGRRPLGRDPAARDGVEVRRRDGQLVLAEGARGGGGGGHRDRPAAEERGRRVRGAGAHGGIV